jgi:O-antigen/teichoic acid export membrane protein
MVGKKIKDIAARFSLSNDLTKKVLSGSSVMILGTIVSNFARVASITFLARYFTKEEFGIWVTVTSVTAIVFTSDFGVANSLRNKLSHLNANDQDEDARRYFFSVFNFFTLLVIAVCLFFIFFSNALSLDDIIKDSHHVSKGAISMVLLVSIILIFLSIPFGLGGACFFSYQESIYGAAISSTQAIITLVCTVLLAWLNAGIIAISLSVFICSFAGSVVGFVIFCFRRKWLRITSFNVFDFRRAKEIVIHGLKFFILQVSSSFIFNSITIVTSSSIGVQEAAEINLIQKLYLFFITVIQSIFNPIWGGYATAAAKGDWQWCKRMLRNSLLFTSLSIFLFAAIFAASGNFLIHIFGGSNYNARTDLVISAGFWSLLYLIWACAQVLPSALNKINVLVLSTAACAIVCVPIMKELSKSFGLLGVTLGGCLVYLPMAVTVLLQSMYILKINGQSQKEIYQ